MDNNHAQLYKTNLAMRAAVQEGKISKQQYDEWYNAVYHPVIVARNHAIMQEQYDSMTAEEIANFNRTHNH